MIKQSLRTWIVKLVLKKLNPNKALIFRIVHRDNVPWLLTHGLQCRSSSVICPDYRTIGNVDLIDRRQHTHVPIPPFGTLSDYVPFYFTPYSPMLLNIKTGRNVKAVPNEEIVIFMSSLHLLNQQSLSFVYSDRHAFLAAAQYFNDLGSLDKIDWDILQNRDFKYDENDPEKIERYQAEALVYREVPTKSLLGVVCFDREVESELKRIIAMHSLTVKTVVRPRLYF